MEDKMRGLQQLNAEKDHKPRDLCNPRSEWMRHFVQHAIDYITRAGEHPAYAFLEGAKLFILQALRHSNIAREKLDGTIISSHSIAPCRLYFFPSNNVNPTSATALFNS